MFEETNNHHFIGIGGSGISALAHLSLAAGKTVTGSDMSQSPFAEVLEQKGATVFLGHAAKQVGSEVDLVIYSEAIDKTSNAEYLEAQARGVKVLSYFEALGELSQRKKTLVVSGSHGKTTTTALLGQAMVEAGLDPTVIVGARVPAFDGLNVRMGQSEWLVVEGCEYRRSFLNLQPFGLVLLNCEWEHPDYYQTEQDYVAAFEELIAKLPNDGFLVTNSEDENLKTLLPIYTGKQMNVDQSVVNELGLKLKLPGEFNRWNATLAALAAQTAGADEEHVRRALEGFEGTARRLEVKMDEAITVIDDYGHHPTEVRATLHAIRERYAGKRVICVFQPHQFSRTHRLANDFARAFEDADNVIIPNIYEARDTAADKAAINAERLVALIAQHHPWVRWGEGLENTLKQLQSLWQPGDVVVTMGAGDITALADKLVAEWAKKD